MSATVQHLPWCVDHFVSVEPDEDGWCQSRRVEEAGYVAYLAIARVGEDREPLHRMIIENPEQIGTGDDEGLSGPGLFRFMDEVKALYRECWRASQRV